MSIADLYDISGAVRRDKATRQGLLPIPTSLVASSPRICNICFQNSSKYNCPRCNIPYCSLACFRADSHQSCSNSFSTLSLHGQVSSENHPVIQEAERDKVFDILQRVETYDLQQQRRAEEDSEDSEECEDRELETGSNDGKADLIAHVGSPANLESASVEALLQMLTPQEKQTFEQGVKSPIAAHKLMERLERKADRLRLDSPSDLGPGSDSALPSPSGLLKPVSSNIGQQFGQDLIANALTAKSSAIEHNRPQRQAWQSQPWFERQAGYPSIVSKRPDALDIFVVELRKLLATRRSVKRQVDLSFNLAAVIMAYSYLIRHFNVECLSDLNATRIIQNCQGAGVDSDQLSLEEASSGYDAIAILDRLVPFLTHLPPTSGNSTLLNSTSPRDTSKIVLNDIDDAVLWLVSHLSYEEAIVSDVDLFRLQLLGDLNLITRHVKITAIAAPDKAEPLNAISSCLGEEQHTFTASQHAVAVNAIADLYTFLEVLSRSGNNPHTSFRSIKSAQRKLCFYLVNAVLKADTATSSYHQLPSLVMTSMANIQQEISNAKKADRVAIANKLAEKGMQDATSVSQ